MPPSIKQFVTQPHTRNECVTAHRQRSKIPPVRQPEADNCIFFNLFCLWVWDSRHGDRQLFSQSLDSALFEKASAHQTLLMILQNVWWLWTNHQTYCLIIWKKCPLILKLKVKCLMIFFSTSCMSDDLLKIIRHIVWRSGKFFCEHWLYIKSRNYSLVHFTVSITMPQAVGCRHVVLPTFDRSCPPLQCARRVNTF